MNSLFKQVSPLWGWFLLMEILTALLIAGFWIDAFDGPFGPDSARLGIGAVLTLLFVGSNILFFRRRGLAIFGLLICWLLLIPFFLFTF